MLNSITIIMLTTFRELIRSKILYSLYLFAFIIVGISALFGSVTIGDQVKVIKDFGLFAISIFTVGFTVISGSLLFHKELSRKTIFTLLARPVERWQFLVGKFLGMYLTVILMTSLMGIGFSLFVSLFEGKISLDLFKGYYHIMLELFIVASSVIFFSSIVVTPTLIGLFSFGLFLAGRSVDLLLAYSKSGQGSEMLSQILNILYWILPQLNKISINDELVYGSDISIFRTIWASVYALTYGIGLLVIAQYIFNKREFN